MVWGLLEQNDVGTMRGYVVLEILPTPFADSLCSDQIPPMPQELKYRV